MVTTKGTGKKVIPIMQEELRIGKRARKKGITRIIKKVSERTESIDVPLGEEVVTVERVAINSFVEEPQRTREVDGVLIVPLHEERVVVEKKLYLKEELHIRKNSKTLQKQLKVALRKQEAIIEHEDVAEEDQNRT